MKTAWIEEVPDTPLGRVWVAVSENGLVAVGVRQSQEAITEQLRTLGFERVEMGGEMALTAAAQLSEYLAGRRRLFDLPIDWSVLSPFQQQALRATFDIPYGQVTTYRDIAVRIRKPGATRAVGRAEATNPMPLVIPCHRVLGSDGKLHGYGAGDGLPTKAWLLRLESGL